MKQLKWLFPLMAAGILVAACQKEDENDENVVSQSYSVMIGEAQPYANNYGSIDTLMADVLNGMKMPLDASMRHSCIVTGADLDDCDDLARKAFETSCAKLDPENYRGKYQVILGRFLEPDSVTITVDSLDFVASADNWTWEWDHWESGSGYYSYAGDGEYIYDMAIAMEWDWDTAVKDLSDNGYTICSNNLNWNLPNTPIILLGYKSGSANTETGIMGKAYDEDSGDMVDVELTAKQAAISYIIASYNWGPDQINVPYTESREDMSKYNPFIRFRQLGNSNGDTNQNAGGEYVYLYYSRSNNSSQVIWKLLWAHGSYTRHWWRSDESWGLSDERFIPYYMNGSWGNNADMSWGRENHNYVGFIKRELW